MASNRSLGTLTLDLIARMGGFTGPLNQASRQASKFSDEVSKNFRQMGVAIATAAAGAATAMGVMVTRNINAMDQAGKMARQIGVSTEALSGLRHAAEQMAGVGAGQFDMALRRMTRRISEAAAGTGAAGKHLEALGLNIQELAKMTPDQQFRAFAEAVRGAADQGTRLRAVMALMDTEGMPLVNMLAEGSEAIKQWEQDAARLGLIIPQEAADSAEEFNTLLGQLTGALKGMGVQVTAGLLPQMQQLVQTVVDVHNESDVLENTVKLVARGFGVFADAIRLVAENLPQATAALTAFTAVRVVSTVNARVEALRNALNADRLARAEAVKSAQAMVARTNADLASARATLAAANTDKQREVAQRRLAAAVREHSAAQATLATASARAAAGVTAFGNAARGALVFFGGPLGLLFTVGATAASFLLFRDNADKAESSLSNFNGTLDEAVQKFQELNTQQQNFALLSIAQEVEEAQKLIGQSIGSIGGAAVRLNQVPLEALTQMTRSARELAAEFYRGELTADEFSERLDELATSTLDAHNASQELRNIVTEELAAVANSAREIERKNGILGELKTAQQGAKVAVEETTRALTAQEQVAAMAGTALGNFAQQTFQQAQSMHLEAIRLMGGVEAERAAMLSYAAAQQEGPVTDAQWAEINRANEAWTEAHALREEARRREAEKAKQQTVAIRGVSSGLSDEARAMERLNQQYESMLGNLDRRVALAGDSSEMAALSYDLEHGALRDLDEQLKAVLRTRLANAVAAEEAAEQQKRAQQEAEEAAKRAAEESRRALEERAQEMEDFNRRYRDYLGDIRHELSLLGLSQVAQHRLNALRWLGIEAGSASARALTEALEVYHQQVKAVEDQVAAMDELRRSASTFLQDMVSGSKSIKDAFLDALDSINQRILSMVSDNLVEGLFGERGSANSSAGGGEGFFSRLFGGLFGVRSSDEVSQALPEGVDPFAPGAIEALRTEAQRMADGVIQTVDMAMQSVSISVQNSAMAATSSTESMVGSVEGTGQEATNTITEAMTGQGGFLSSIRSLFSSIAGMFSGGGGGGGGWMSTVMGLFSGGFGGGRAFGGGTEPFGLYRVNELGPELLSIGQTDYLMMGSKAGNITPNNKLGGGGVQQVNNFQIHGRMDRRTETQIAAAVGERTNRAVSRTV